LYRCDDTSGDRAQGGVAISVMDSIFAEALPLTTSLQAVAVRVALPSPVTLCNIYFPPHDVITQHLVNNLLHQLPRIIILLGDFKAHNVLWGDSNINRRGKVIEDILRGIHRQKS
jgi:Endonuclease-reverse transcriptase